MPIPGAPQAPQAPMASQGAMGASQQAERKATREVPTDQLNAAMQKGAEAVASALYQNRKTSQASLKMIREEDKIGSTAKAATLILSEINKQAQLPERIMVPLAIMTADELMDMAEQGNRAKFSEQEAQQVALTTSEMILTAYGVPQERAAELAQQASQQDLQKAEDAFNTALNAGGEKPAEQPQESAAPQQEMMPNG